jgi:hypothetical protein
MQGQSLLTTIHYQPFRYFKGHNMAHLVTENGKTFIRDEWHEEDIQNVADCNYDVALMPDQVQAVMELIVESFDANIGIDWEVIGSAIDQILDEKVSL